jgi:hypothetical protein
MSSSAKTRYSPEDSNIALLTANDFLNPMSSWWIYLIGYFSISFIEATISCVPSPEPSDAIITSKSL